METHIRLTWELVRNADPQRKPRGSRSRVGVGAGPEYGSSGSRAEARQPQGGDLRADLWAPRNQSGQQAFQLCGIWLVSLDNPVPNLVSIHTRHPLPDILGFPVNGEHNGFVINLSFPGGTWYPTPTVTAAACFTKASGLPAVFGWLVGFLMI